MRKKQDLLEIKQAWCLLMGVAYLVFTCQKENPFFSKVVAQIYTPTGIILASTEYSKETFLHAVMDSFRQTQTLFKHAKG